MAKLVLNILAAGVALLAALPLGIICLALMMAGKVKIIKFDPRGPAS